ncbi:MAG: class II fumarate hydratase [Phycisphaerae bacterium]|nr:class II fumarate hydratase [Phycisphaerae bacterium]
MTETRRESDAMGEVEMPAGALYGPQTARAVANFPVSGWMMPPEVIAALGHIKLAAAEVNKRGGGLDAARADAIAAAAADVADGTLDAHFPVDVFQTGSATSTNMNANEVIARRAEHLLRQRGAADPAVHPNDHVNRAQSSNDVIPTALRIAAAGAIRRRLGPALRSLRDALAAKAGQFDDVVKIGRTHLMDAVPVRLGQEFGGYAAGVDAAAEAIDRAAEGLHQVPIGGTAVGTGLNAPPKFGAAMCRQLSELTGLPVREAPDRFAAQSLRDAALLTTGALRNAATTLGKIASDLRLLGSGPRCGLGELRLPAVQPGSSIMPGKVNPVLCESVVQVACQVAGCDAAIAAGCAGGVGGILELNVAMPMIAWNLLTEIRLLTNVAGAFERGCVRGIEPDRARCGELVERSLATVTALTPKIGYDRAAGIAQRAHAEGKTVRDICLAEGVLTADELDALLDARQQTRQ